MSCVKLHFSDEGLFRNMSYENHFENEREKVNILSNITDHVSLQNRINNDWTEAVSGWKQVTPNAQYSNFSVSNVIRKKNKPNDKMPDWQRERIPDFDEWLSDNKVAIRCVGDDFSNIAVPPWKANVEQGTYRYVPNNGYYRTMKFLSVGENRDWFTVHKKHPEKVSMSWQNRRFQKEIKRQLKRQFESHAHKHEDAIREKVDRLHHLNDSSQDPGRRSRSQQSSPMTSSRKNDHIGSVLPSLQSAPPGFMKSASDLYIENFSSRLSALEAEIKRDSRITTNSMYSSTQHVSSSRKLYEEPLPKTTKNNKKEKVKEQMPPPQPPKQLVKDLPPKPVNTTPQPLNMRESPSSQELFTVKAVGPAPGKQELKPIERVTPAQKMAAVSDRGVSSSTVTQLKYTNATTSSHSPMSPHHPHNHVASIPTLDSRVDFVGSDLTKTLNSYKLAIENTKQSLFNTMSSTKIPRRNKGFSTPSAAIAICDSAHSGMSYRERSGKSSSQSAPLPATKETEKHFEKKAPVKAMLPEISGRKLEIPTHRWL